MVNPSKNLQMGQFQQLHTGYGVFAMIDYPTTVCTYKDGEDSIRHVHTEKV